MSFLNSKTLEIPSRKFTKKQQPTASLNSYNNSKIEQNNARKLSLKATSDTNEALFTSTKVRNPHPSIQPASSAFRLHTHCQRFKGGSEQMCALELSHSPTMRYFLPNLSTMSALQHGRPRKSETARASEARRQSCTSLVTLMQTARATGWNWGNARRWPLVFLFLSVCAAATNTYIHRQPVHTTILWGALRDNNTLRHRCALCGSSPLLEKSS